ncbi:methyltransferase [Prauserella marina]|uniref:Predicted O-methyltransferase YrrM n=1 Tax=Prauserella marina TaxID=530584 RepID=A0A222VMK3_9PSEU|nr:O-methyltransferase [Prauserella marina]ASR35145.1 methyltransferase [Prauserella marina]PWV85096.1 putative O-methyltransferase YrrM [Prauserella marina]SDC04862.1 Predicted O-methyltransferase YrrM [Prauserella marina]
MSQSTWDAVDAYFADHLIPTDPALDAALATSEQAGLPAIAVSAGQGKLLNLLTRIAGASSVLEIGTLGGYSTIWLGKALPAGGTLVSLESDAKHAEVARGNVARAGLADVVDIRVGPALDTLPGLRDLAPFDLVFIDADKPNNPHYLNWALELTGIGSVIIVDNVVRGGSVADSGSTDAAVRGVRELTELIENEPRLDATALQTVGSKGYDGFAIALVTG